MSDWYLHSPVTLKVDGEDVVAGRNRLPSSISRRSARRMTHLGTLIARVLNPQAVDRSTSLIYGSTYAETRTLENYVDSFPNPSPLLFQSSIHPSAIQQLFVASRTPMGEFIPLCGDSNLVASMFNTAFRSKSGRVLLVGGEEQGSWMLEHGLASAESWAWSLELNNLPENAAGIVQHTQAAVPEGNPVGYARFFRDLSDHRDMTIPNPSGGSFRVSWI